MMSNPISKLSYELRQFLKKFCRCEMYNQSENMSAKTDKAYQLGDEILRCKIPFAYVVNKKLADTTCDECLKRSTDNPDKSFLRCSGNCTV